MPAQLPEAPLSINFKVPEVPGAPMLTVRGSNGVELAGLAQDVALRGADIGKALTDFRAGFLAGAGIQSEAPQAQSQQQHAAPAAPPQTGGNGPAPFCPHGQRVWRAGVSQKNGRPYQMWACPASQSDPSQCKPEYVK